MGISLAKKEVLILDPGYRDEVLADRPSLYMRLNDTYDQRRYQFTPTMAIAALVGPDGTFSNEWRNLLYNKNPSFETGAYADHWNYGGTAGIPTLDATQRYVGTNSARSVSSGAGSMGFPYSGIGGTDGAPVTPGNSYSASVKMKADAAYSGTWVMQLYWYDSGGTYLSASAAGPGVAPSTNWQTVKVEAVGAPANAAYGRIVVTRNAAGAGEAVNADAGGIWNATYAPPYASDQVYMRQAGPLTNDPSAYSILFDGEGGGYVNIPAASLGTLFDGTSPFTFSFWIKSAASACPNNQTIITRGGWPTQGFWVRSNPAGTGFDFCTKDGAEHYVGTVTLTIGSWTLIVCTYDGTNGRIYKNGSLTVGPTAIPKGVSASPSDLYIGGPWQNGLAGNLSEVALYDHALPAERIAAHYAAQLETPGIDISTGADGFSLKTISVPPAPRKRITASSQDTEGSISVESQYEDRQIAVTTRATSEVTRAAWYTKLDKLQAKLARMNKEGGVLQRTLVGGLTPGYYDLSDGEVDIDWDSVRYVKLMDQELTLSLTARPFVRTAEIACADHVETTLPVLIFTEADLKGDVDAIGRLVIDADQGDQWWAIWGERSRYYSSATSAALFYECEALTAVNGSTVQARAGASGGNTIRSPALVNGGQLPVFSASWTHVGKYRIIVRAYQDSALSSGLISSQLVWGFGDLAAYRSSPLRFMSKYNAYILLDFGTVDIPPAPLGTQTWQLQMMCQSYFTGDKIDFDYMFLVPVLEGWGEASAVARSSPLSNTNYIARDEFNAGGGGSLSGKTADVGGVWAGAGDATDFTYDSTNHYITRNEVSDANFQSGRVGISGMAAAADQNVSVVLSQLGSGPAWGGVVSRYVDINNYMAVVVSPSGTQTLLIRIFIRVAGTVVYDMPFEVAKGQSAPYSISLATYTSGGWIVTILGNGRWMYLKVGSDVNLATGGALASGKAGIYDVNTTATVAGNRVYDNFLVSVPVADAAIFATRSLQISDKGAHRLPASGGTVWSPVSDYIGDNLRIPVAGTEDRITQFIVKACRSQPDQGDPNIDDISARLYYTARWLQHPDS